MMRINLWLVVKVLSINTGGPGFRFLLYVIVYGILLYISVLESRGIAPEKVLKIRI